MRREVRELMTSISRVPSQLLSLPLKGQDLDVAAPAKAPLAPPTGGVVDGFDAGPTRLGNQFVGNTQTAAPIALAASSPTRAPKRA
jgi:hypothetical protein